ncbi:MAG: hypothetical protein ACEQR8_06055 [Cypionkella sp.]
MPLARPVSLLATALALAGCATSVPAVARGGPALDEEIVFADPATCRLSPASERLIGGFVRNNLDTLSEDWIRPGTVPAQLQDRLGPIAVIRNEGWLTVRTEARATLWGLPLTAIEHEIPDGGDPGGLTFEFAAPPRAVERAARARGLPARAGKDVPLTPPDALVPTISLHRIDGGGSALTCGYA